jgi:hypothetical protein
MAMSEEVMADFIRLLHAVPRAKLASVMQEGLRATSAFDDLGLELRRGVVYCWLRREDDKMWGRNAEYTYIQVTVERSRCQVADMEFSSLALMYLQGQGGKPRHAEAAKLLAQLYEVTTVPLREYREGMFFTPEVLVRGNIAPEHITVVA